MVTINADLQSRLKELEYFFNVLDRAAKKHNRLDLSENEVRAVLQEDVKSYTSLSPKLDTLTIEDKERFEEAKKQIELNQELTPTLKLIAGITLNRMSEAVNNRQQMGQGMSSQQNDALVHPKLAPFLDQAASSFLDAYRQIQDEQKPNNENKQDANENKNELTLQYKNAMKNRPEFKKRLEAAPQYVPTVKPNRPF